MLQHVNFLLLDADRMGGLIDIATEVNREHDCLHCGLEAPQGAGRPYLFRHRLDTSFGRWMLERGWGHSWGVYFHAQAAMDTLYWHFHRFLVRRSEAGSKPFSGFSDPRLLRAFLPACNNAEVIEFFGPVDHFFMEDEDPLMAVKFWHRNGVLRTQRIWLADLGKRLWNDRPFCAPDTPAADPYAGVPGPVTALRGKLLNGSDGDAPAKPGSGVSSQFGKQSTNGLASSPDPGTETPGWVYENLSVTQRSGQQSSAAPAIRQGITFPGKNGSGAGL